MEVTMSRYTYDECHDDNDDYRDTLCDDYSVRVSALYFSWCLRTVPVPMCRHRGCMVHVPMCHHRGCTVHVTGGIVDKRSRGNIYTTTRATAAYGVADHNDDTYTQCS